MSLHAVQRTDVGRLRDHNEDAAFAGATVFVVADGLGGHAAGEVASAMVVERLSELDGAKFDGEESAWMALVEGIEEANTRILERAEAEPEMRGMGTTCTAALLLGDRLVLAHVGDSRAYVLGGGQARQVTVDQTPVQRLVEAGAITPEDARTHPHRSALDQAVGLEPHLDVATPAPVDLGDGERLLLCSDGLTEVVDDEGLATLAADATSLDDAADALVRAALEGGGPDNITLVLLERAS